MKTLALVRPVARPLADLGYAAVNRLFGRRLTDIQYTIAMRLAAEHQSGEFVPTVGQNVITQAIDAVIEAVSDEFEATDPRFDRHQFHYLARYGVLPLLEDDPLFVWSWSS